MCQPNIQPIILYLFFFFSFQMGNIPFYDIRLKFDIKMYFKIINNLVNVDSSKFFMFASIDSGTRGHCYKLRKRLFCSNRLFNSFSNRAVDCWNSLPEEMVGLKSYVAFSRKLRDLELTKFLKGMSQEACSSVLAFQFNKKKFLTRYK